MLDAHWDDSEFGYWILIGEAAEDDPVMCWRTVWRICLYVESWSVFGMKRGKNGNRSGPPVHDDMIKRVFFADDVDELWLTDGTERWTHEGKLYFCVIKDMFAGRIVGYSIATGCRSASR